MTAASDAAADRRFYLEDLHVGQRFNSGTRVIDEAQLRAFATAFDPQPFHLDDAAARETLFGGLAASGWHTAAITMRLLVEGGLPIAGGIIGAGAEIAWPRPTRPGDRLQVESEVLEIKPSRSRSDRGMATVRSDTRNQHGEIVYTLTAKLVVPRCAGADGTRDRGMIVSPAPRPEPLSIDARNSSEGMERVKGIEPSS